MQQPPSGFSNLLPLLYQDDLELKENNYVDGQQGENPLRCTTEDKKGLILVIYIFFTLYFDPHKK